METTREYTIGRAKLVAKILEGEVLQADDASSTHVYGYGGGESSTVHISSSTSWNTKVWVNQNGKEAQWVLPDSFAFRPGHKIAICKISDGKRSIICLVKNVTTDTEWVALGNSNIEVYRNFVVKHPFRGFEIFILGIATAFSFFISFLSSFSQPSVIVFIALIACTGLSVKALLNQYKRDAEAIKNMINDISKIMPST